MNVAKSHPYTRDAACFVFRNKFDMKSVKLDAERFYQKTLYQQKTDIDHWLHLLESFGHLISKLTVDYSYLNNKQTARFNKIISKINFDSLIAIDLKHCDHRKLKALPKPLKNVKTVRLHGQFNSNHINIREFFPMAIDVSLNDETYEEATLANLPPERTHEIDGFIGFLWKFLNL